MPGQVLLKIVCLLMRWLFSLAVLMAHGDRAKDAELLVLRSYLDAAGSGSSSPSLKPSQPRSQNNH